MAHGFPRRIPPCALRCYCAAMLDDDLALAREMASMAADVAMEHFRRGVAVRRKADGSQVTEADLAVEAAVVDSLAKRRPGDAVLAEERGAIGKSRRRWIVDPIDGTAFFAAGRAEQWGTHIALEIDTEVVLGIISRPVVERVWWAIKGGGAHCGPLASLVTDETLRVSTTDDLRRSRAVFWAESDFERRRRALLESAVELSEATMDCILELTAGRLDIAICGASAPWDLAPGVILVEEAGGLFTDPAGGRRLDMGEGWYSNGRVHGAARVLLRDPSASS
jgi:histidinol-phosphatase